MMSAMRNVRAALAAICGVALGHAAFFIYYQQPDWNVAWTDQGGYRMLAHGLLDSGTFTRYPEADAFVPEAIRTPGYPAFVALVYAVFGDSQLAVVIVQAFVFAALCLVVYATTRHIASERVSLAAAAATALYPTFPYFGALVLTELWTAFVLTCGVFCCLRAVKTESAGWFAAAGLLTALTALTRPGFFLLPVFLALPAALHIWQADRRRRVLAGWAVFMTVFAMVMAPWFLYNYRHFGRITLSAAGSLGRPVWEASWQGRWTGRTSAELTRIADRSQSDDELVKNVEQFATQQQLPSAPMLEYTRQWRTIRVIWTTPTDPEERVRARIIGDEEYLRVGLDNIRQDPAGYVRRRLTRGLFVLWAADVPIRHSDIDRTATWIIRTFWLAQAVLVALALFGIFVIWRQHGAAIALLLAMPLVYVTAVHLPILCEARQSLPVKPLVLMLAVIALAHLSGRSTSRQTAGS
jgi:4-amino-4-deoxy-L-arabinose transferase-like glycosyltransferase